MSEPASQSPPASRKRSLPRWLKWWASYGVAFWTLALMAFLTWRGTMAQRDIGIHEAQNRYFESWLVIEPFWPSDSAPAADSGLQSAYELLSQIAYPLPGGALLMTVLTINLLGGLVRIFWRWNWSKLGALTGHLGVLLLLAAAAVSHLYKREGFLALTEGQTGSVVQAYTEPVIEIRAEQDDGTLAPEAWTTTPEQFRNARRHDLDPSGDPPLVIDDADLPFRLEVLAVVPNSMPVRGESLTPNTLALPVIDGVALAVQEPDPEAERNAAGALVRVLPRDGSTAQDLLLYEHSTAAAAVDMDDRRWWIDIRPQSWQLPFSVRLDRATSTVHPGTTTAASYESEVTRVDPVAGESNHRIYMNHPLRTGGYTLFQAKMSRPDAAGVMSSTFEVVHNPSDQWPTYACWVIAAGLLGHFLLALIKSATRRRTPAQG